MLTMNRGIRYILCGFAALVLAACSGAIDPEQDNGDASGSGINDVPEGTLRIFADKAKFVADGNEEVTFTVMFGSKDVSNEKTCQIIREFNGDEKFMAYGANRFSTVTAGTYKFKAKYYYNGNYKTDNEIEIVAEQFFTGEAKNYRRRYFGTLFTSTGCNYCPMSSLALKALQAQRPGEISVATFHDHFSSVKPDPMTVPETAEFDAALGGHQGLPKFYWNMRKDSYFGGSATEVQFAEELDKEMAKYETYSGIAVRTSLDESSSKLDVEVGITSNMPSAFRYVIILVEDGIPAVGDYAQESNKTLENYTHDNCVRKVLTGAFGDKINDGLALTVGVEAKASKSVVLPEGWKRENMRVIAVAMTSEDGGGTWTANNVNECKLGESVSYLYAE